MPTELATVRLVIAPWRKEDLDNYAAMVGERDRRALAAPQAEPSREELRARICRQQTAIAEIGIGLLTVRVGGDFAGYCGLTVGHSSLDEPDLAYEFLRAYHGNGHATEAAHAIVDHKSLHVDLRPNPDGSSTLGIAAGTRP